MKPSERLKMMAAHLEALSTKAVYVGVPGEIRQDKDGKPINMAELAAVHEFGSADGRIPERSFLRASIKNNRADNKKLTSDLLRKAIRSGNEPEYVLGVIGVKAVGDVQAMIANNEIKPALKASTVKRKGSSTVLLDTGQLEQSVISEIRDD